MCGREDRRFDNTPIRMVSIAISPPWWRGQLAARVAGQQAHATEHDQAIARGRMGPRNVEHGQRLGSSRRRRQLSTALLTAWRCWLEAPESAIVAVIRGVDYGPRT
jgi:hypothetical protein